jgi:ATP/maltotriose-dependent transcriptional regulator MalT
MGRVEAAWPDALLATKLHVPRAQPGYVARPRLASLLDAGLARGLILVCAPAGSGKTSLLASWARTGSRAVAWLSLDPGDNDPARFWRHLFAALDPARPGIGARVAGLLSLAEPPPSEAMVTVLVNEFGLTDVVLVLDDFHVIDSAGLLESVAYLAGNLPPGLRLVLASRSEPPLPLARLRARGQLAELGAADLRFTVPEAAALLADSVSGDAVATLTARTEGWAAGLRLAALSLRGHGDAARFVADFSGSNRYVLDYLTEEVLDAQPADVRAFLLETSVADRLSGSLCDALTGRADGQRMLERIERAGLFLVPLDEVRGWWRYHHLFASLLRVRLDAERPGRAAKLHAIASWWHESHGLADDAIRHAVAAGDMAAAARLIELHFDEAYMTGERATVARWLSVVPDAEVRARPRLRLGRVFAALVFGDMAGAAALLDGFDELAGSAGPFTPAAGEAASLLVNVPAGYAVARAWLSYLRGQPAAMTEYAALAKARLHEGQTLLALIYQLNLALADWMSGRLGDAEGGFAALAASWRLAGASSMGARSDRFLGQVQWDRGALEPARRTYARLVALAEPPGQSPQPIAGYGYAGLAEVAYQRDQLDEALRYATEAITRCRLLSEAEPLASSLAVLACIRQARADPAGALAAISEAEQLVPSPTVANLLNPVPAQRARLLLAQGDVAEVARWVADQGIEPSDEPSYLHEREHLVLVRLLLARGQPDRALELASGMLSQARRQERTGNVIELLALRALALAGAGDRPAAAAALGEALVLASPHGHVRVFADEGAAMAGLLGGAGVSAAAGGVSAGYLARVLRACRPGADSGGQRPAQDQGLVDPLTARELEVLALLAAGTPNQGIADSLVVTLDTVKKHVTHVLAKLGAANRTEAVARAREIGLLAG